MSPGVPPEEHVHVMRTLEVIDADLTELDERVRQLERLEAERQLALLRGKRKEDA